MMARHSRWSINYSTDKFLKTGDVEDLCFNVVTQEGFKCKFVPTIKGLHVFRVDRKNCRNIFGSKGVSDEMYSVDGTYYATLSIDKLEKVKKLLRLQEWTMMNLGQIEKVMLQE